MPVSDSPHAGIYMKQTINRERTLEVDASSVVDIRGTLNLASGTITMPPGLASGQIDLTPHLWAARELSSGENIASGSTAPAAFFGGLLLNETTPALAMVSTADEAGFLFWTSNNVDGIKLPPVMLPSDFSTAGPMNIELFGEAVGSATAADAIQAITIKAWFGVGNTNVGSTHPNFTTTPSYKGISIASGSLTTDVLNLILIPQAHAGRALRLFGARARYLKKSS